MAGAPSIVVAVVGAAIGGVGNGVEIGRRPDGAAGVHPAAVDGGGDEPQRVVIQAAPGHRDPARRRDHGADRPPGRAWPSPAAGSLVFAAAVWVVLRARRDAGPPPSRAGARRAGATFPRLPAVRRSRSYGVRLGCIDIGSNTTRLLVADSDGRQLTWIHQERAFTRIGHELFGHGSIGPAKIDEVVAVVAAQLDSRARSRRRRLSGRWPRRRSAAPRTVPQLAEAIARQPPGSTVEILSGEEEARLAFVGVAGTLEQAPPGSWGWSMSAVAPRSWWSARLPNGCGGGRRSGSAPARSPTAACARIRPPAHELAGARSADRRELSGSGPPQPATAVAVGGSATSLGPAGRPGARCPGAARALDLLAAESSSEIARRFMIDPERARLLPAGLLILEGIAELLGAALRVGRGGIREGVLLEAGEQ